MSLKLTHPNKPLSYPKAIAYIERWITEHQVTADGKQRGYTAHVYDYLDGNADKLSERPWLGARVSEVSISNASGGGAYMQVDVPWGIAVCGQVERCIIALVENWNRTATLVTEGDQEYWDMADTEEEFWRLGHLFEQMEKDAS